MKVRDFSKMPVGTKVQDGEIQICPHCGRAALLERVDDKEFFTHSQTVGINEKGGLEINWQSCPELPE